MAYQVELDNFQGPLDLLLRLVEQTRLSATELSLGTITEQYITHVGAMEAVSPAELSQFAALAARLVHIKSQGLFASEADAATEELAELEEQLAEYGRYRDAAQRLRQLWRQPRRSWSRPKAGRVPGGGSVPNLTVVTLQTAYRQALTDTMTPAHQISPPNVSLTEMTARLRDFAVAHQHPTLQAFFAALESREEVVAAFVTALELWRSGRLQLVQADLFTVVEVQHVHAG